MMTVDEFMASLEGFEPPDGLSLPLRGLWHGAKGEWDTAHKLVQDEGTADAAWVHGHLHRAEGDLENARYWYTRGRKPMPNTPLEMERASLALFLIGAMNRGGAH